MDLSEFAVAMILGSEAFGRLADGVDDAVGRRELDADRAEDDCVPWDEMTSALGAE